MGKLFQFVYQKLNPLHFTHSFTGWLTDWLGNGFNIISFVLVPVAKSSSSSVKLNMIPAINSKSPPSPQTTDGRWWCVGKWHSHVTLCISDGDPEQNNTAEAFTNRSVLMFAQRHRLNFNSMYRPITIVRPGRGTQNFWVEHKNQFLNPEPRILLSPTRHSVYS